MKTWVTLKPSFDGNESQVAFFRDVAQELDNLSTQVGLLDLSVVGELRNKARSEALSSFGEESLALRLAISVLCDLFSQGWQIRNVDGEVAVRRPSRGDDRLTEQERVRRALLIARDEQLSEPSVKAFIKYMETKRLGPRGHYSIFSLMRDGVELARELDEVNSLSTEHLRVCRLKEVVKPYVQVVSEDSRCEWTGLKLSDVWRYFRHTWLTPARSTPGRGMMILIRDAATEPHPVVGIAAISSSIVQQSDRDKWIGWDREGIIERISAVGSDREAQWLLKSLQELLDGVYVEDLIQEGIIRRQDIRRPPERAITALREFSFREKGNHQARAKDLKYKRVQESDDWSTLALTPLYRAKRASMVADLLSIRRAFLQSGFADKSASGAVLQEAAKEPTFRKAVGALVRMIKAARVGINMMDISVAGAVAPYNHLLGGKLVSLLLASQEVRDAYFSKYKSMNSIIASAMRGRPTVRKPDLVLLVTTGIFSGASSQYNRIKVPAARIGGKDGFVEYKQLKRVSAPDDESTDSVSTETRYSTFHFSQSTISEMKLLTDRDSTYRINSIFGEGVNPKMRKIREALSILNFAPDELLQAGSPRVLYVVPLAHNFREVLLGLEDEPNYILPSGEKENSSRLVSEFWIERWLARRIENVDVLQSVGKHTGRFPRMHGATVQVPSNDDDEQLSFRQLFADDIEF